MTFKELVKHFGSQAAIARALGLKPPSISAWQTDGIPPIRQLQIERITSGKLRADRNVLDVKTQAA